MIAIKWHRLFELDITVFIKYSKFYFYNSKLYICRILFYRASNTPNKQPLYIVLFQLLFLFLKVILRFNGSDGFKISPTSIWGVLPVYSNLKLWISYFKNSKRKGLLNKRSTKNKTLFFLIKKRVYLFRHKIFTAFFNSWCDESIVLVRIFF